MESWSQIGWFCDLCSSFNTDRGSEISSTMDWVFTPRIPPSLQVDVKCVDTPSKCSDTTKSRDDRVFTRIILGVLKGFEVDTKLCYALWGRVTQINWAQNIENPSKLLYDEYKVCTILDSVQSSGFVNPVWDCLVSWAMLLKVEVVSHNHQNTTQLVRGWRGIMNYDFKMSEAFCRTTDVREYRHETHFPWRKWDNALRTNH